MSSAGCRSGWQKSCFQNFIIGQIDDRRNYGEKRMIALVGPEAECRSAFTPTMVARAGSSACGTRTGESDMSIVRRTPVDTDRKKLLADLAARPQPSEEDIERWAEEDGGAMTDEELAQDVPVYPPTKPEEVRALRARLELSQSQFSLMFGFSVDTVQQYEQGRRVPSGPASTLLRVIAKEPEAVNRALAPHRERRRAAARVTVPPGPA
jgi:putative transcriptional regulator